MDLRLFLRTLLRRWPIVVVILALAGGGTYLVTDTVGPTYETTASTLIFPPKDPGGNELPGNPYLELSGLTQARDILIRTLSSKTTRTELETSYPKMTYEVSPDYTNSAPIILFTVQAPTPATASQALQDLGERVPTTLASLQEGRSLRQEARITSVDLTQDLEPEVIHKNQIRAGILSAVGILGLGLLVVALLDGLLAVRRRSRRSRRPESPGPDRATAKERVAALQPDPAVTKTESAMPAPIGALAAARAHSGPERSTFDGTESRPRSADTRSKDVPGSATCQEQDQRAR